MNDVTVAFEYNDLPEEVRDAVREQAQEIRSLWKGAVNNFIEIGSKLVEVKRQLGHGHFCAWVKAEFGWSHSTALNYMRTSETFGGQIHNGCEFSLTALYLLAAPSTPEAARQEALDRAGDGEQIDFNKASQIVQTHKGEAVAGCDGAPDVRSADTLSVHPREPASQPSSGPCDNGIRAPVSSEKGEATIVGSTPPQEVLPQQTRRVAPSRVKPPIDAGDAYEPPPQGSPEEQQLKEEHKSGDVAAATPRDRLGQVLPRHLRDAFADTIYFDLDASLDYFARKLNTNPDYYVRLRTYPTGNPLAQRIRALAAEAKAILEYYQPHSICPSCKGSESGCVLCFTTGWICKGQYEERQTMESMKAPDPI